MIFFFYILLSFSFCNELLSIPTIYLTQNQIKKIDLSNFKNNSDGVFDFMNKEFEFEIKNDSLFIQSYDKSGIHIVDFLFNDKKHYLVLNIAPSYNASFNLSGFNQSEKVYVMGNFNDWSRTAHPLFKNENSYWSLNIPLSAGRYEYKFVVDKEEILDPDNSNLVSNGLGGYNSVVDLGNDTKNNVLECFKSHIHNSNYYFIINQHDKYNNLDIVILIDNQFLDENLWNYSNGLIEIDARDIKGKLRIFVRDDNGSISKENITIFNNGKALNIGDDSWYFSIIYSLMIDRFKDGNKNNNLPVNDPELNDLVNFHGGDFQGVLNKINDNYFNDLGINTIWISPIQQNPYNAYIEYNESHRKYSGYHGYWPISPRSIDSRFGTDEEFKNLVNTAHNNNIKILLDFVSNHTHEDHPYYKNHKDWYGNVYLENGELNIRNWSKEKTLTTWFDKFLPSFDYVNSEDARNKIIDDAIYFIDTFNIDGFRQDATKHVPHIFWKSLKKKLVDSYPNKYIFQIGETFGNDDIISSYVNPKELDSQFNFNIYFKAREHFSGHNVNFEDLNNSIIDNMNQYGPIHFMGNLTSSHDQVRFMAFADNQIRFDEDGNNRAFNNPPIKVYDNNSYKKLLMFYAMNISLPGVPILYYGEEIGEIGANDPGNRLDMKFDNELDVEQQKIKKEISRLNYIRLNYPSMSIGDFQIIYEDIESTIWLKRYFNEIVLIAFNNSNNIKTINLNLEYDDFEYALSLLDRSMLKFDSNNIIIDLKDYEFKMYKMKIKN